MWFSEFSPLTCKSSTLLLVMIVSIAVIVLSLSFTGWTSTFSLSSTSSKTNVESLCVSNIAYVRTYLCGSCAEDTKTGTMLEVAEARCVDVWDTTLCTSWFACSSVEVGLLTVSSTGFCLLLSCKHVG